MTDRIDEAPHLEDSKDFFSHTTEETHPLAGVQSGSSDLLDSDAKPNTETRATMTADNTPVAPARDSFDGVSVKQLRLLAKDRGFPVRVQRSSRAALVKALTE